MTLADLITSLRILSHDGPTDHVVFGETLGSRPDGLIIDGINTTFRLGGEDGHSLPLVASSVYMTAPGGFYPFGVGGFGTGAYGGTYVRTQQGFTVVDLVNGFVTFTYPPSVGMVLQADYNCYWFSDAQYTEFLNEAAQTTLSGISGPTFVPTGLVQAMLQFALALFFESRASQYAERYATSGGEAGQSVDSVAKTYMSLSDKAMKRGQSYRDDYYKRQGQREAPASAVITFRIDPITPFR